ncbi:MAG: 16S rRNA (adenine(1518)-N(6)/adenine(1519)-N(6))-dimethyltransferase RsmA [Erysipelotrichaceae bacterium]|nr:16S rRNA (adenine(1518)-N(6)/adenine(1519)-N(6))-dimethyltransferase RsmA [Erysipelotrichaceae bacterium]
MNPRALLKSYGLRARKHLGQNFLSDENIARKIAKAAVPKDGTVLEIGPGLGALTRPLCARAKQVIAVEIDSLMVEILKSELADVDNLKIVSKDILKCDLSKLLSEFESTENLCACGNLPYYITTPILFLLIEAKPEIQALTLMMQREVGARLQAKPNTKDYNALSVLLQLQFDIETVAKVPASCFYPAPQVDSLVLQLRRKPGVILDPDFAAFVKQCFKQRRKTLRNNLNLNAQQCEHLYAKTKIKPEERAESLTLQQFERLYQEVRHESQSLREN